VVRLSELEKSSKQAMTVSLSIVPSKQSSRSFSVI
jgi:hypothetical protein